MCKVWKILASMVLLTAPQICLSEPAKWLQFGTFAVYEHATKRIELNGVATRYGIGALGAEISANLIPNVIKAQIKYGIGYHPKYELKSFGTEFSGPVNGNIIEYGFDLETSKFLINGSSISVKQYERHIFSDKLTGTRGGVLFKTSTDAKMSGTELILSQEIYTKNQNTLDVFLGANLWQLKASGTAYSADLTAIKNVNGKNNDPLWGFNAETMLFDKPLHLGFTHRTINADNNLETFEIFAKIAF